MPKFTQVLLSENVENLGIVGDVVKVRSGYARNYLLPYAYAEAPSEERIQALASRRAEAEAQLKKVRAANEELFAKVQGYELTIVRATNEQGHLFGGVSQHEIAEALRKAGFAGLEDRHVRTGEKITRVGAYTVPVQLAKDLKTEVKLNVKSDKPEAEEVKAAPAPKAKKEEAPKADEVVAAKSQGGGGVKKKA